MSYRLRDSFYRRAKREGYRSRAAYKLLELNKSYRLIKFGDRVLDLGAAPGGWLQVASELVGPGGRVVGVDCQSIAPLEKENVDLLQGDVLQEDTQNQIRQLLGGLADCVLSDLSPRLTGIHDADVYRSIELARIAIGLASTLLRAGGNCVVKTFIGKETEAFFTELKPLFASLQRTRAEATRKHSSELYLIGKGFRP